MAKQAKPRAKLTRAKKPRAESGEWKPAFLKVLAASANVRAACKKAGISRQAAYKHRSEDEKFSAAWQDALEDACDDLEAAMRKQALKGCYQSQNCLLKAHRPHKYRENHRIEHTGAVAQVHLYLPQKDAPPN